MKDAFFAWSGGKDSALALHRVLQQEEFNIKYLLTTVNKKHQRITMHGVRVSLLEQQAQAIGIPLKKVLISETADMASYEQKMQEAFLQLKSEGINTAIFGDIFLEDLRKYREKQLAGAGMQASFPLWHENTTSLVEEFVGLDFEGLLVCVSEHRLGEQFIGQPIDSNFLAELPAEVDPGGENGEYHSFVYDGPIFQKPVPFQKGDIICRDYAAGENSNTANYDSRFWFIDLLPVVES